MSVAHLIYLSRARIAPGRSDAELAQIQASAQRNNTKAGVTGLLLYNGGHFLQLLEGDDLPVLQAFDRISGDPRHDQVQRLIYQNADERLFEKWAMGIMNVEQSTVLDQRRFAALAAACHQSSPSEQLALLYREFRGMLPASAGERVDMLCHVSST